LTHYNIRGSVALAPMVLPFLEGELRSPALP
jgi:hypothetical protein